MLKNAGRKRKKRAKIKCDNCKEIIDIDDCEIISFGGIRYIECPYCGLQIILNK